MSKMTRYLLSRMTNSTQRAMPNGRPQGHKFGFGSEQEMQRNNREYYPESRARRGGRGYDNAPDSRYGNYDEQYGYDMQTYRDDRRGY